MQSLNKIYISASKCNLRIIKCFIDKNIIRKVFQTVYMNSTTLNFEKECILLCMCESEALFARVHYRYDVYPQQFAIDYLLVSFIESTSVNIFLNHLIT